jgi:hypothetical protein
MLCLTAMRFFFKNEFGQSIAANCSRAMLYSYLYEIPEKKIPEKKDQANGAGSLMDPEAAVIFFFT